MFAFRVSFAVCTFLSRCRAPVGYFRVLTGGVWNTCKVVGFGFDF